MKIRLRLALLFTLLAAAILLVFAAAIYFSARNDREKEFYSLLQKEAVTKANLFLDAKVDTATLQRIYRNNRQIINEVEVAVYDGNFRLLYHDAVDIDFVKEHPEMLAQIRDEGMVQFYQDGWQVIGLRHEFEGRQYLLTAAAYDQYGYNKLESLLRNIVLGFTAATALIYGAGLYFARRVLQPIAAMTEKARLISATHLDLRLPTGRNRDELSELAATFNNMLSRLEHSFDAQKNFVSNISHELRTPLAAMIAELELAQSREYSVTEYQSIIRRTLGDAQKMARLTGSLLDLARAEYDPAKIAFRPLRIDEVLFDARQQLLQTHLDYRIDICFANEPETEEQVMLNGNEYLLKVALINLLENGCKFSAEHHCTATLHFTPTGVEISIVDEGIGIAPDDLPHIFEPFYRGANSRFAEGNGIGLSLTQKIVRLHKGNMEVYSETGKGTRFLIIF
ncbi:MAG: HAMP domain-containing sensor histidine kinase [Cytophagales bacterium]|nr:HAMP domain-containing histidine kinase [Bernardetiaceae bacterium]MDW8205013.1 HAMP domain-containing sensor histidine kinase [Cytophagales bacterium]